MNFFCNDIVKSFKVKILRYADHMRDIHDLAKYLPLPLMKVNSFEADNQTVRNQEFTAGEIRLEIKYGLPRSMQDELDDHPEDYFPLAYEDLYDLLSITEVKDESKMASAQIKKIASARAVSLYLTATSLQGFLGRRRQ